MTTMTGLPEPPAAPAGISNGQITEDEASLYDRQIRLWGLEAQNRMRSSTVLILSLKTVAHEIIKNLVLAGIGRLIVMDNGVVTEEDLGSGFLFREEEGAVGQERTTAATPQIQSLNPLVSLTALPTLSPFVRDPSGKENGAQVDQGKEIEEFLKREKVDVVVACDLSRCDIETLDTAAQSSGTMIYATGSYGFYGYAFANLGEKYQFVYSGPDHTDPPTKKILSYPSFSQAFEGSNWVTEKSTREGGSPYRGLMRIATKEACPGVSIGVLAMWEFEKRHNALPDGSGAQTAEVQTIAEEMWGQLGINPKGVKAMDPSIIEHMSAHHSHYFPPTLAILGGLVAQDVLRCLSRKGVPIANLLAVDSMGGTGNVGAWGMGEMSDDL